MGFINYPQLSTFLQKMAQNLQEVLQVLTRCGLATAALRNTVINNEGFHSLEAIGLMEGDTDVTEMAKQLSSRRTPTNT